jgi:glycosyltransferase involved in cell wall biosynthesis
MTKFSIITISKNQGKFIKKCIDSILEQNLKNFEHIVIDANSDDQTHSILKKYNHENLIIKIEKDKGAADGLNKGFALSKGKILCFINSDDYLLPKILNQIEIEFSKNTKLEMIITPGIIVNEKERVINKVYPSFPTPKKYVYGICTFFQQGIFFKSDLFNKTNGFNVSNKTNWDGELFLDLLKNVSKENILRLDIESAAFKMHAGSITSLKNNEVEYEINQRRLFNKIYGLKAKKSQIKKYLFFLTQILTDPKWFYHKVLYLIKYGRLNTK